MQRTVIPEAFTLAPSQAIGDRRSDSAPPETATRQDGAATAGGFVDTGAVIFKDVTATAGLGGWGHTMGTLEKRYIVEANGSGVALLDYDNDGWLDIYLVNGSTFSALAGKTASPHAALFHNNHDGTFTDVASMAGVTNDRWGVGAVIGDYDNDGWPDIYVSNYGRNRLYHNDHDGTFTDVAEKAGVTLGGWSTGATWGDYDGDGKLDLFVPGYVDFKIEDPGHPINSAAGCRFRGALVFCGPKGLKGEQDHLFHNNGNGTFTDVSTKAGVSDPPGYYGLAALFVDVNGDGRPDLLVANDSTPNYFYLNKGDGTYEDVSYKSNYAVNGDGVPTASMAIAAGDYRNNGRLDFLHTTFSGDYKVLYQNDGNATFSDVSYSMGLGQITFPFLSWGAGFFDYDNDGWQDLFIASGHVYPIVDQVNWGTSYAEKPLLFHNEGGKRFTLPAAVKGTGLGEVLPSRGAAFGDLFNDGKMDAVINNIDHSPALLRNVDATQHHWVELKLVGGPRSPRDAVGTVAFLKLSNTQLRGDVLSGGSYASSNDQRLHFGLNNQTKIGQVELHWPSGNVERVTLPMVDAIYTIEETRGVTQTMSHTSTGGSLDRGSGC
jgi:hypothetical protein